MMELTYENFIKLLAENLTIEKIRKNDSNLREGIQKIKNGNKVYIWPSASMGERVYKELKANGYENLFLVDKNNELSKVISPDEFVFDREDVLIIATLRHSKDIYNLAKQKKCKNILMYYNIKELGSMFPIIFPEDFYDKCFEELTIHLLKNIEEYKYMYFSLQDDASRKTFLNNMFFRLTYDVRYTFEKDEGIQYFDNSIIDFDFDGSVIDGGGYNGDTLEQFLELNRDFKDYHLFEPDGDLLKEAKKVSNDNRIYYINKGLYSTKKTLSFNKTMGDNGCIVESGNNKINVVSIDEYFKEKVSFIKMDIEGCELEALKGAQNIIKQYSPTLAICIYHKAVDYLEIFNYIRTLNKDYKFFLRHYSNYYTETVLYAVSKTREMLEN
ncbi:FkbM family methyltransferase [Clostridium botulinum]|uniref:FkbM family methyltransferase n=1 Tax=Clostridium botulinum TaxID=1491 RepID=UPI00096CC13F|nr:FkbM family methyltransferase [Clostridium botulinum]